MQLVHKCSYWYMCSKRQACHNVWPAFIINPVLRAAASAQSVMQKFKTTQVPNEETCTTWVQTADGQKRRDV